MVWNMILDTQITKTRRTQTVINHRFSLKITQILPNTDQLHLKIIVRDWMPLFLVALSLICILSLTPFLSVAKRSTDVLVEKIKS